MLIQFQEYLTFENIYLWSNFGVLPFWVMLILIPSSKFAQFFINSIIIPLILSTIVIFIIYQLILLDESIIDVFKLYLSLDNLYTVFATEAFLLIFWIHFITILGLKNLLQVYCSIYKKNSYLYPIFSKIT